MGNVFKAIMPAAVTCDSHYCTCLGHFGGVTQIGSFLFYVPLPKVAVACRCRLAVSPANITHVNEAFINDNPGITKG
jgi:hypothetical protein